MRPSKQAATLPAGLALFHPDNAVYLNYALVDGGLRAS
jgi:hypothetical protein